MNQNSISFTIHDKVFGEDLSPTNLTLPLLSEYTEQVIAFLRGNTRKDLSSVQTKIKKGSLAVVADNETGILNDAIDDYSSVHIAESLDEIDPIRARIIETWQAETKRHQDRVYKLVLGDSGDNDSAIIISSETDYKVTGAVWVDVELYLYGRVYDLGGKNRPNVHIELENGTSLKIETNTAKLIEDDENRLYKDQLVRIKAKRNIATKELREERLISFERYNPIFDRAEFERIATKARLAWNSVADASKWVEKLRGSGV